jgi:hypothetical protein
MEPEVSATGDAVYLTTLLSPGQSARVLKYSLNGDLVWVQELGSAVGPTHLVATTDGVYALWGNSKSWSTFQFLRKLDHSGNTLGTRQFSMSPGTGVYVSGVSGTADGVYVAGYLSGAAFVRKYDPHGIEQWTRQFGMHDLLRIYVAGASPEGVYVAGPALIGTPGPEPGEIYFDDDGGFVRKYDTNGNELWTRKIDMPMLENYMSLNAVSEGVYLKWGVGQYGSSNYLRRYDRNGNLLWSNELSRYEATVQNVRATDEELFVVWGGNADLASLAQYDPDGKQIADVPLLPFLPGSRLIGGDIAIGAGSV